MPFPTTKNCQKRVIRNAERDKGPGYTNPGDTHLVGGQSPRFIGADHIRTTKSLDTGKVPDNRVLLGHLFCSEGKACSDNGGETLWDSSNGECDGNLEVVDSTMDRTSVGWVPEVPEVDGPDEDTNNTDNFSEHVTKVIQLALKRCLLVYLRCNGLMDIADSCLLTGEYHNSLGVTIYDSSSLGERK